MIDKDLFVKRIQESYALGDKYIKDSTIDILYKKLCIFDYLDLCKVLDFLEDNGIPITYYNIKEELYKIKKNKEIKKEIEEEKVYIESCDNIDCIDCKYPSDAICVKIGMEVLDNLKNLLDIKTRDYTLEKLNTRFKGAGFDKKYNKHDTWIKVGNELIPLD